MLSAIRLARWTLPLTFWYFEMPSEMALWAMLALPSPKSSLASGAKAGAKELYILAALPRCRSTVITARRPWAKALFATRRPVFTAWRKPRIVYISRESIGAAA